MVEIYLDKLTDIFFLRQEIMNGKKRQNIKEPKLKIKSDGDSIIIEGVVEEKLEDKEQALELYMQSIEYRKQASTNFNEQSSRSHLIFTISVEVKNLDIKNTSQCKNKEISYINRGKITIVDLAGSENLKNENNKTRQDEGIKVNQSLSALKHVIASLIEKKDHIPYNDNILTKIMKDSLGGNAKTLFIINISPASSAFEQSKNSL